MHTLQAVLGHLRVMADYQQEILKTKEQERDNAQKRCQELEQQLASKSAALYAADQRLRQDGDNEEVSARVLHSHTDSIIELSMESRLVHDRCQQLEQQLRNGKLELEEVKQRFMPMQQQAAELEDKLRAANECKSLAESQRQSLSGVRQELVTCKVEYHRLRDLVREKMQRIADLEASLREKNDSPSVILTAQLDAARTNNAQLQQRASHVQAQLELALENKSHLASQCHSAVEQTAAVEAAKEHARRLECELVEKEQQLSWCQEQMRRKQDFVCGKASALSDSFVINKQAYVDRHKWSLSMWSHIDSARHLARAWFEFELPHVGQAFLLGSFYNWEVAVPLALHQDGRIGIWLDLPRGRHEFCFLVDGRWRTSQLYATCRNEFYTNNNIRVLLKDDDVSSHLLNEAAYRLPLKIIASPTPDISIDSIVVDRT